MLSHIMALLENFWGDFRYMNQFQLRKSQISHYMLLRISQGRIENIFWQMNKTSVTVPKDYTYSIKISITTPIVCDLTLLIFVIGALYGSQFTINISATLWWLYVYMQRHWCEWWFGWSFYWVTCLKQGVYLEGIIGNHWDWPLTQVGLNLH